MRLHKKPLIISTIGVMSCSIAVLIGLVLTGMYVGWGPFNSLFWNQEVNRIKKSYDYDSNQESIVFYGASNFRLWNKMNDDLNEYKVVNSGFGGSTDKLMNKYSEELLYPYNPKIVFFQTGSNDYVEIEGSEQEKVQECMKYKKEMFSNFHKEIPEAKFVIMSGLLLPGRNEYTSLTIKINNELKTYASSIDYIDFVDVSDMTFDGLSYKTNLFEDDGIHLNRDGQIKWCDEYIKPKIISLIEENPSLSVVKK